MDNKDPDQLCVLCGTKRDEHGDRRHGFSTTGELVQLPPSTPARSTPPSAPQVSMQVSQLSAVLLRLIETLASAGVISGTDLVAIFGGGNAPANRGSSGETHSAPRNGSTPERGSGTDSPGQPSGGTDEQVGNPQ